VDRSLGANYHRCLYALDDSSGSGITGKREKRGNLNSSRFFLNNVFITKKIVMKIAFLSIQILTAIVGCLATLMSVPLFFAFR